MRGLRREDDGAREGLLTKRSEQNCLTPKELEEYLFHRVSGATCEAIEEHLLVCSHCLDRIDEEEAYIKRFRAAARRMESEDLALAMNAPQQVRIGWLAALSAGWAVMSGHRTALALAGVALVAVSVVFSPLTRGPATETAVVLSLARGAGDVSAGAPAGGALQLSADVTELPPLVRWQVEVVNASGKLGQRAEVVSAGGVVSWQVKDGLASGRHWVRLRDPSDGALVREFALQVR